MSLNLILSPLQHRLWCSSADATDWNQTWRTQSPPPLSCLPWGWAPGLLARAATPVTLSTAGKAQGLVRVGGLVRLFQRLLPPIPPRCWTTLLERQEGRKYINGLPRNKWIFKKEMTRQMKLWNTSCVCFRYVFWTLIKYDSCSVCGFNTNKN